jgi:NADH:ubiquinone oxidoreductase subunit H
VKHGKSNQIMECNLTQYSGEQLSLSMILIYQKLLYMFSLIVLLLFSIYNDDAKLENYDARCYQ